MAKTLDLFGLSSIQSFKMGATWLRQNVDPLEDTEII
jgi:hypothetical protein